MIEAWEITTVYPDGRTETRMATPEEVAQRQADIDFAAKDFSRVRAERNSLLAGCDWTVLPDAPLSDAEKVAWQLYRQQLRDLPGKFVYVNDVVWPTPPGA